MSHARRRETGFTLVELIVTVAIAGVLASLAYAGVSRMRPRATLQTTALDLRALLNGARQSALASGRPVVVMVFPTYASSSGTGRIIVYQDGSTDFFQSTGAPNFGSYTATNTATGPNSEILETYDLDRHVLIGPLTGQGPSAVLPAPFTGIAVNTACGFCGTIRGAVVFAPDGSASFYSGNGAALALPAGASLSLTVDPATAEFATNEQPVRTLVIAAPTGALSTRSFP